MKFFKSGGLIYGVIFSLWRGYVALVGVLATLFYRRVLGECGHRTRFGNGVYIAHPKRVQIGSDCYIGSGVRIGCEHGHGMLLIGNGVQINEQCKIDYTGDVIIGDYVLISAGVHIYSHDHGYNPRSIPTRHRLVIEKDAWIGAEAMILSGVGTIGQSAVVGAGAVATKLVPDNAIVAGNPAKLIKLR